jgi:radical SAM protein with 4Fe4S-binding SPASM domain
MLTWDIWEKICVETSHWPEVILNFGTDGEPLLHPRFLDMLRLARKYSIYPINITTNGVIMNDKFNKTVIQESLVDIINISIDANTPETYKKIRGGNYQKVVRNVKNLIDHRNRAHSPLKIQVNYIDQPESRDELGDFKKEWEKQVDNVMIRTYYDATAVTGETGSNITGKQAEFENVKRWPCQQLWRRFNISDDGTVRFCVDDWFNKTKLGDLKTQTIRKIWTGNEYNRLRHLHITSQFSKIPYCSKCTEWQGMKWDYDYFTAMKKMLKKDLLRREVQCQKKVRKA